MAQVLVPWVGKGSKPLRAPSLTAIVFRRFWHEFKNGLLLHGKDGRAAWFILAVQAKQAVKMKCSKAAERIGFYVQFSFKYYGFFSFTYIFYFQILIFS